MSVPLLCYHLSRHNSSGQIFYRHRRTFRATHAHCRVVWLRETIACGKRRIERKLIYFSFRINFLDQLYSHSLQSMVLKPWSTGRMGSSRFINAQALVKLPYMVVKVVQFFLRILQYWANHIFYKLSCKA